MTALNVRQQPMRLAQVGKREVRSQFAALPWRIADGKIQVLIITSRRTKRWIVPKGWPIHDATPAEAAATEAMEEAGAVGTPSNVALGFYSYRKEAEEEGQDSLPIVVAVFPLRVKRMLSDWPEKSERKRKWVSRKKAAQMLGEPELRHMVRDFDPRRLGV